QHRDARRHHPLRPAAPARRRRDAHQLRSRVGRRLRRAGARGRPAHAHARAQHPAQPRRQGLLARRAGAHRRAVRQAPRPHPLRRGLRPPLLHALHAHRDPRARRRRADAHRRLRRQELLRDRLARRVPAGAAHPDPARPRRPHAHLLQQRGAAAGRGRRRLRAGRPARLLGAVARRDARQDAPLLRRLRRARPALLRAPGRLLRPRQHAPRARPGRLPFPRARRRAPARLPAHVVPHPRAGRRRHPPNRVLHRAERPPRRGLPALRGVQGGRGAGRGEGKAAGVAQVSSHI
ncbi:hypothetical protein KEM52_003962, partial [Ascosphaera acerosa]